MSMDMTHVKYVMYDTIHSTRHIAPWDMAHRK